MNSLTKLAGTKFGLQEQQFRQPSRYCTTGNSQTYDEVYTEWNKKQRATVDAKVDNSTISGRLYHTQSIIAEFNPLKTNVRLLYLKTQSVPRCKHFSSRL